MNRIECLESLLRFDRPLAEIKAELKKFGWDCDDELVTLARSHVVDVLSRCLRNELSVADVEEWANVLEGRDDIGFENGDAQLLSDAVFAFANPVINEAITTDGCRQWLQRLGHFDAVQARR